MLDYNSSFSLKRHYRKVIATETELGLEHPKLSVSYTFSVLYPTPSLFSGVSLTFMPPPHLSCWCRRVPRLGLKMCDLSSVQLLACFEASSDDLSALRLGVPHTACFALQGFLIWNCWSPRPVHPWRSLFVPLVGLSTRVCVRALLALIPSPLALWTPASSTDPRCL